ncbi:MAG: NADPH-dependent F420 reductase [Alphaproteobacteria bacterium]
MRDARGAQPLLAVIGGSGALGSGLAQRLAKAGYPIVVGTRDASHADEIADMFDLSDDAAPIKVAANAEAAASADIILVTVPFAAQEEIAQQIRPYVAKKLVIDTTVPLAPPRITHVNLPENGSAALSLRTRLGDHPRVVSAFHNIPARKLRGDTPVDSDILVFGDDPADRQAVITLANGIGIHGVHGGALVNSVAAEALTPVLIGIGQIYKIDGAGIRITGVD